ncbi:precorrin-6Y C5,15-methyltransferase (decarboxylating) subunit CbiT [Alkalibaculum sp. M08DMB]|uniref:Precorrin-6Y C5,15-methyltransferase (Decarboxylating) subunit CbiT n=1 Tax=Alkalibaculum sporogenes TaxID=2655001 RepID=A0A6A7KAA5_9FIRM|nr:precorrin-6Y C5,15-methyltransferase (decarboxylating) subunit CbiT [Alkalibaculum sporogenes]MPW26285.1 precorrin-6Y C5,15-methyltransferase (decarboxylating) subunit CbiT [Alkalibaculum sporogenes]
MSDERRPSFGIPDEEFIRGKIPMTKEEIRVITLSKLQIQQDSVVLDIGAGTGSISIECSLIARLGKVYAVEVVDEGIELIKKNIEKFGVKNITPIHGMAPKSLEGVKIVDRIVVGGSRGNIVEILEWANDHLSKDGIIVANFITIENLFYFIEALKEKKYEYELTQVTIAKSKTIKDITMMQGHNPVFIVKAQR